MDPADRYGSDDEPRSPRYAPEVCIIYFFDNIMLVMHSWKNFINLLKDKTGALSSI